MDWINVNRITPKPFVSVLCRMPGEKPFPTVHEGYISDDGIRSAWKDIFWLESTDPEYINEILDYSEFAEHDDSPDSAASLLRKLEQRTKYNPIKGGI